MLSIFLYTLHKYKELSSSDSTLFISGLMMMPATVLVYFQLGQFLMLVMVFSWCYSTFSFLSICAVIGPKDNFGQLSISHLFRKCGLCRVKPEVSGELLEKQEVVTSGQGNGGNPASEQEKDITTTL